MNTIIGAKAAIVTPKPQTTRQQIIGIYTDERCQIVFTDTPGIHKAQNRMNRNMVRQAYAAAAEADVLAIMQDASHSLDSGTRRLIEHFISHDKPRIHILNKVDQVKKPDLLPRLETIARLDADALAYIPLSAMRGTQIQLLLETLFTCMPEGDPQYDPDWYTDQSQKQLASEYVREQIFLAMQEEVPFQTAVEIESFREVSGARAGLEIGAVIIVSSERHKPMLIGQGGSTIKKIGSKARFGLQSLFDCRVHLDLWVKAQANWFENTGRLRDLGLG